MELSQRIVGAAAAINAMVLDCHAREVKAGWWNDPATGDSLLDKPWTPYVVATKLCLIHSEITEAVEGHRRGTMDDKLPHRPAIEVELTDAVIRIFNIAGALKLDLGGAYVEKNAYNDNRPDHKPEARAAAGGKAY